MALQNIKVQVASIVLLIIVSLVFVGNQATLNHKTATSRNSRAPASIGAISISSTSANDLQLIVENDLAEEVAAPSAKRTLASVGEPATAVQTLRYGALEGKYAFKMEGEK